mgnify:CR=1 FL=1
MADKKNAIRVLNVTTVFKAAGIESFIMNMYRNIDREKVQFDFMVMRDEKEYYDDEIEKLGGKKYTISKESKNILVRILKESKSLYTFLKSHPYEIVHIHYTTPLRAFYALAAKKAGVKVIVYHSHSAEVSGKNFLKRSLYSILRKCIENWATDYFACSEVAAEWMFPPKLISDGKAKVVYNGIDVNRFRFSESNRTALRNELGLSNEFVIIHTGRFLEQKNHKFVLEVFKKVKMKQADAKLLLLGTGNSFDEVKNYACELNISDSVHFLGVHADVERYLSAADCYIMPSLYEGLPVAAVEAECSGLPCYLSTNITKEVALTDVVKFMDLSQSAEEWADEILSCRSIIRKDKSEMVAQKGYDVHKAAKKLQDFYENAAMRN